MRYLLYVTPLALVAGLAPAQPSHHGRSTLFLVRADARQAGSAAASGASATAAIIIDRHAGTVRYDLTYQGLTAGPRRIALHNGDRGAEGPEIMTICGDGAAACPARASARLAGELDGRRLEPRLLSEFASARIYLRAEAPGRAIRGQVEPNGAMARVRNYVAPLAPRPGTGGTGEGTAVLSETYLPNGRVDVEYSVTVAGTRGTPTRVTIGKTPRANLLESMLLRSLRLTTLNRPPRVTELPSPRRSGGGSLNGRYTVRSDRDKALFTLAPALTATQAPVVAVQTDRFPNGELVGVFQPVN